MVKQQCYSPRIGPFPNKKSKQPCAKEIEKIGIVIDGKSDKSGLVKVCTIHPIDSGLEGEEIYYPNSHNMSGKVSFVFDSTFLALSLKP